MTTVSLILGSGGARGLAHIGVIHYLEENGYRIESISGCSIGALVGGIYAAGQLDQFESWVRAITKLDILALLDLSWSKTGLVKGDRIINTLIDLVGDIHIEDLPIRYTAVAADVNKEREVWMNSGRLFDAIRASISLPMFFTPHYYNGAHLIDGGVLNPVPIAPTFSDKTDMSIAVNLGGELIESLSAPVLPEPVAEPESDSIADKISHYIDKLKDKTDLSTGVDWDAYAIANQAFDAMQSTIARQKLAAYPPDQSIILPRNACSMFDFDRAGEMIELGYNEARKSLTSG